MNVLKKLQSEKDQNLKTVNKIKLKSAAFPTKNEIYQFDQQFSTLFQSSSNITHETKLAFILQNSLLEQKLNMTKELKLVNSANKTFQIATVNDR